MNSSSAGQGMFLWGTREEHQQESQDYPFPTRSPSCEDDSNWAGKTLEANVTIAKHPLSSAREETMRNHSKEITWLNNIK